MNTLSLSIDANNQAESPLQTTQLIVFNSYLNIPRKRAHRTAP